MTVILVSRSSTIHCVKSMENQALSVNFQVAVAANNQRGPPKNGLNSHRRKSDLVLF
jgi:hypothetical protein